MTDIQLWKLALDGALLAALIYMCFRFSRIQAPNINMGQLRELDSSLKQILRESQAASSNLSDELFRKKQELEQLLFDIQTADSRINKSIDEATSIKKSLRDTSLQSEATRRPVQTQNTVNQTDFNIEQIHQNAPVQENVAYSDEPQHVSRNIEIPEPPSFSSVSEPRVIKQKKVKQEPKTQSVNIYGEPIGAEAPQTVSLKDSIEKEVYESETFEVEDFTEDMNPVKQSLEDVYGAADDLLRAGNSFQAVSETTNLPIDEVKMLSQIIEQEQVQQQVPVNHESSRQKVLSESPVKRARQVL